MGKPFDKFAIVFICGMVGVILAFIVYGLYSEGIIVDEYITGTISITDVMSFIILAWSIIGVVLAAIK